MLRGLFDGDEYLPEFSVVAELDGEIVGHVYQHARWVGDLELLGLGPIGVTPRLQRHGIGSALMHETVVRANAAGERVSRCSAAPITIAVRLCARVLPRGHAPDEAWGDNFQLLPLALWPGGVHGIFRYAAPLCTPRDGIPLTGRPSSPIGRGSGLKIRVLWVRVPPGVQACAAAAVSARGLAAPLARDGPYVRNSPYATSVIRM